MEMRLTKKAKKHIDRLCADTGVSEELLIIATAEIVTMRLDHTARRADIDEAMNLIIERDKATEPPIS